MSTYICNIGVHRRCLISLYMVALHISSLLLTGACIDGEVAGCKRVVGLCRCLDIHLY